MCVQPTKLLVKTAAVLALGLSKNTTSSWWKESLPRRNISRVQRTQILQPCEWLGQTLPGPSSVQFSHSVVSNSLQPHGLQHARPPCPSPTPGAYSNLGPLNPWCHPTISSSVVPFSSCLQSFPASGSFQMSLFLTSGGQSVGVSAPASVLPMNIQDWFPLGWTGWIVLQSKGLSRTPKFKSINSLALSFVYSPTLTSIHNHWKSHSFD